MEMSCINFPLSSRSITQSHTNLLIRIPPTISTTRRRITVVRNGIGDGSAKKYKGTQMRVKKLNELIEAKVVEATEICNGNRDSDECKVAWDEVEEVSQAKADLRRKLDENKDPLQSFCEEHPETDECRIYED
uniref:calvin cycle protein CP12-3, chloroplastic-like n=1 Tax=Erigeron canadensis TaxID=72917 RepID=UPI001CB99DA2|nr:calvin cycle protein CP12-3, chloroplastic-like [Erigeron canadensis]